jgi:hypothetical protein
MHQYWRQLVSKLLGADRTQYGEKTGPGHCSEQELIAQRSPMINEAREVSSRDGSAPHGNAANIAARLAAAMTLQPG